MSPTRQVALCFTLVLAGCQFDASVPDTTRYSCTADGDCPSPMRCQLAESRCVKPMAAGDLAVASVQLDYVASSDNLQPVVTAATVGTTVRVKVTLNQPATCRALRASPADITFTLAEEGEHTTCEFSGTPQRKDVEADCALDLDVTDSLGITRTLSLGPDHLARIDTLAPPRPDVDTPGAIEYFRAPFGSLETQMTASNHVTGKTGSVEANATVLVIQLNDEVELRRVVASASGGFGPVTFSPDPERIGVSVLDGAGNPSPRAVVRDITWVVNHGGVNNPHRLSVVPINGPTFDSTGETTPSAEERAGLARADGTPLTVRGGQARWQEIVAPDAYSAVAYDSKRGRLIAVGPNRTAAWDGTTWEQFGPALLSATAAAYDPFRDRLFALTTLNSGVSFLDGAQWRPVATQGSAPSVREDAYFAFDPLSRTLLLVGGFDPNLERDLAEVWSFDGTTWTRRAPAAVALGSVRGAFDPVRGEHVLFGGLLGASPAAHPGTVALSATGIEVRTSSGPTPRTGHCMAWNPGRQRVVLAGGFALPPGAGQLRDLWEWDGTRWTDVTPPAGVDLGTDEARCVFDSARDELVVKGQSATRVVRDDGSVRVASSTSQSAAPSEGAAVWSKDRVVLAAADGGTFSWQAGGWTRLTPGAHTVRQVDVDSAGTVLGVETTADGGLQMVSLNAGGWTRLPGVIPAGTSGVAGFFDRDAGAFVADTSEGAWSYSNGGWLQVRRGASGLQLSNQTIRYSPTFGAPVTFSAWWSQVWNGSGWAARSTIDLGFPRRVHVAAATEQRTLAFRDGTVFSVNNPDAGAWDAVQTFRPAPAWSAQHPDQFAVAFNEQSRRLWVHDGQERRTFQLELDELRPAVISRFALPAIDTSSISSVNVVAQAGGSGGAQVRVLSGSRWSDPSGHATNASANVAPVSLVTADADAIRALIDPENIVTVAIEPNADNGGGAASVSVDYVQFSIHYRLQP